MDLREHFENNNDTSIRHGVASPVVVEVKAHMRVIRNLDAFFNDNAKCQAVADMSRGSLGPCGVIDRPLVLQ
jgi:hypothetical protein